MLEPNAENEPAPGTSWWHYAAAALALIVALFLLSTASTRSRGPVRQTEADLQKIQSGDANVKLYFLSQYASKHHIPESRDSRRLLSQALDQYSRAARRPSPAAIRRTGVLTYELRRPGSVQILDRLRSEEVLKGLPKPDKPELRKEAAMWQDIYTGSLSTEKVGEYSARIRQLNLGPVKAFALKQLYERAGRPDLARRAISEAESNAASTMVPFTLMTLAAFPAGIAGIVFIFLFIGNYRRWLARPEPAREESRAGSERIGPPILFGGFIAYIVVSVLLAIIARFAFEPTLQSLTSEKRLVYTVALDFGLTAASGAVALAFVYGLIRQAGGSLEAIGLTRRNFRPNLLWGLAGYCTLLPLLLAASWIWQLLARTVFRGVETPVNPIVPLALGGSPAVFWAVFVMGTVLAPFFEEIFFRGLLYGALRMRLRVAAAVLISAAAFAIVHPFPGGFLPILAFGIVFALLREIRGSLVPSMVAHALNNAVMFLMIYFISVA